MAFGVVNQYYWYRMQAELGGGNVHSKIAYLAAHDPGYVLNVSGAAILKSSKHQADDRKFLAFLVSRAGQEIIAHSVSFEYPLDDGVQTAAPETADDRDRGGAELPARPILRPAPRASDQGPSAPTGHP